MDRLHKIAVLAVPTVHTPRRDYRDPAFPICCWCSSVAGSP